MNKQQSRGSSVGAASLLTVFAVLCLAVFAVLSLATVSANERLGNAAENSVTTYYEADCRAEEILARLRCGEVPEDVSEENGVFRYDCPISDTQTLAVEVAFSGGVYQILRWQAVSVTDWQADDSLPVWNGD